MYIYNIYIIYIYIYIYSYTYHMSYITHTHIYIYIYIYINISYIHWTVLRFQPFPGRGYFPNAHNLQRCKSDISALDVARIFARSTLQTKDLQTQDYCAWKSLGGKFLDCQETLLHEQWVHLQSFQIRTKMHDFRPQMMAWPPKQTSERTTKT